jgi:hypothetical protein
MFKVSYLAHGFDWSADYIAKLDAKSERMDLAGWATVTNASGKAFNQAELQLVAGRLNVLEAEDGGSRAERTNARFGESPIDARRRSAEQSAINNASLLSDCFVTELPSALGASIANLRGLNAIGGTRTLALVTANSVRREIFGDYHLYRLPWLTDLGPRQTKQVLFLDQRDVEVERFYRLFIGGMRGSVYGEALEIRDSRDGVDTVLLSPTIVLRAENTFDAGLGEPLPEGRVRVFEPAADRSIYVGYAFLADRSVGSTVELEIGRALDVLLEVRTSSYEDSRTYLEADILAINDKSLPIDLEVLQTIDFDYVDVEIEQSSRRGQTAGDRLTWRFEVPPGSESLSYRLSAREIDF